VGSGDLAGFLSGLGPEWGGLSLTMPLKQAVLPLLDRCAPLATAVGAANTLVLRDGERAGHNTDVHGIVAALAEVGVRRVASAAVLGGGATAASAIAALLELGCPSPAVLVRSPARTGPLLEAAERLGSTPCVQVLQEVLPQVDVVVSTVPSGAADALRPPASPGVLLDVVYDPWPSPLAVAWAALGGVVVDGVAMLLHQAAAQVELMTGRAAPVQTMRAALPAR
jgi:shikimate dehydrogenase